MRQTVRPYMALVAGLLLAGCQGPLPTPTTTAPQGDWGIRAFGFADQDAHVKRNTIPGATFSNPLAITNPYSPFATINTLVLEGPEGDETLRSVQTRLEEPKIFRINGEKVPALVIEDRVTIGGVLEEVALDYYAQADDGTVYYLGEDVDIYEDGKIVSHEGAWLFGRNTQVPGVIMPANPQVGDTFNPEAVPARGSHDAITESAVVLSTDETVTVPFGTFTNVLRVRLVAQDGSVEIKFFAPGIGVIREEDAEGFTVLTNKT